MERNVLINKVIDVDVSMFSYNCILDIYLNEDCEFRKLNNIF